MPSLKSSSFWILLETVGKKRLFGLGALLAWLVLFHLLVNVWFLCIFTSLLVVLGGWLGSWAVLDANSLLHLEHFLPLWPSNPQLHSPEDEWRLNNEIDSAVHKAVRDFVSSWYRTLLPEVEGEFEWSVRRSMLESVMELKARARRVNRKALVQSLLELYGYHLQSYQVAKQLKSKQREAISLWKTYSKLDAPHPAVSSEAAELSYSRALVNLALHVLVPYPQMETRTGGYMVTELITCNVLLPLISRVSDPDWLNQTIVDTLTKSRKPQEIAEVQRTELYRCQPKEESCTTCRSLSSCGQTGVGNKSVSDLEDHQSPGLSWHRNNGHRKVESLTSAKELECCHTDVPTPCKGDFCSLKSGYVSTGSKMTSMESLIWSESEDNWIARYCDCGPMNSFCSMRPLKDAGCFGCRKNLELKGVIPEDTRWPTGVARGKHKCRSLITQCSTLQNVDEKKNKTSAIHIKNTHIFEAITAKEQHGTGKHSCNFCTLKMAENASGTLRTSFLRPEPLSPTEDLEGDTDGRTMDNRKYRRLMFPGRFSSSHTTPDLHPKVSYCFGEGTTALNGMSLSVMESFVRDKERLFYSQQDKETSKQRCQQPDIKNAPEKDHGTGDIYIQAEEKDTAVADVALNILCLLMKGQWSWLCTENIQKTIRLLFGTFIERWMDVGVAHLTSASGWVIYLQVLQEAVWPGGMLPSHPHQERSAAEREETKQQCLHCLKQLLPEPITEFLGDVKFTASLETMMESLQDPDINKHLIYCICDLLLDFLIPESCDEAFQRSFLQSLTPDTRGQSFENVWRKKFPLLSLLSNKRATNEL